MIENPSSFTFEYLSGLKFKELQKLSVQFNVNKRWAKKHELIENLLGVKNRVTCDKTTSGILNEDKEWVDGSIAFGNLKENEKNKEKEVNRLTFDVKPESRLTYDVPQNGKNLLNPISETVDPRQTYEVPPKADEFGENLSISSRETFEIPQKEKLTNEEVDPRATFDVPQNGKKLLEEIKEDVGDENMDKIIDKPESPRKGSGTKRDLKLESHPASKEKKKKSNEKVQSQQTMLTIPYTRITRRTRKDGEDSKHENSPIKMSKKSINIKKTVRQPTCMLKSPSLSSIKKPINRQTILQSLSKTQPAKPVKSKIPTRLQFNEEKTTSDKVLSIQESGKENVKKILRRKSKTADEVLVKKINPVKVSFMSPPVVQRRNQKVCTTIKKTPIKITDSKSTPGRFHSINTQTPNTRPVLTKPITATKMPDFHKIHQKQFDQMDSLHDYLKKKEERTKRLFGTSQEVTQNKVLNKSTPVFKFGRSTIGEKPKTKSNENENVRSIATPLKRKDTNIKAIQKETFKTKLPPTKFQTDIKDKNRSHIHGVRTNKRFELQMKFRNM